MITLFSKPNCAHCVAAKNYLARHEIPFFERDITADAEARTFVVDRGHKTVPQLYVGEALLVEGGNASLQKLAPADVKTLVDTLKG